MLESPLLVLAFGDHNLKHKYARMNKKCFILIVIFITCRNAIAQHVIPLYADSIPNSIGIIPRETVPTITSYLPDPVKSTGAGIIIFPGGAYAFLATETEGTPIAEAFVQRGIAAFVVKYRLPNDIEMRNKAIGPMQDAEQAIRMVRMNAKKWGIDSNKIGIIGFSAGGHVASTLGTHFSKSLIANEENISLRPDFMILVYPVISMNEGLTHMGSRVNLLGTNPSRELVHEFSNEENVTPKTPPTYITQCGDDQVVSVYNSIVFYEALQKNGVDAELHLYPKGDHGFTQRLPVNEWLDPMLVFLKKEGFLH